MRSKIMAGVALAVAIVTFAAVTAPAHAVVDPGYLNQPRAISPQTVGEWHTLNNQPPKWIVIAKPYGVLTGICAIWGARWDAMYQPFLQSTGALEGFVSVYAMDSSNVCRVDLPIQTRLLTINLRAVQMPYDQMARTNCGVGGVSTRYYRAFARTETGACTPYRDWSGSWLPGFFWIDVDVTWQFDDGWPQHSFYVRTWAAELTRSS